MSETSYEKIHVKNGRLSFPSVFQKAQYKGKETKYEATVLIPKSDKETFQLLKSAIQAVQADTIDSKTKKTIVVPKDKWCLKDGDESGREEYAGYWTLKASSNKRPLVMNADKSPLTEDDDVLYSGCRVNALIGLWVQDNDYGKRVNANLHGIQFAGDDEPFATGTSADVDDFDEIEVIVATVSEDNDSDGKDLL